jgi:dGTPase
LGTAVGRTEFERDYDRILFSTPTRRLADKTQVFPMEINDSIRTRLTHSHEVSNLARSIGVRLAFENADRVFGESHEQLQVKRNVPALLAAVGLAHDLGNPPFGHQGELAMQQWFSARHTAGTLPRDFLEFDGNAQTFRLLTRLQVLSDYYGLNLTVGTLAALIKYPTTFNSPTKRGFKKHGIFRSEADIVEQVWLHTGLGPGIRHPLAYVMEACDDIAYSIIDAEDTVKKGYASFFDLMDALTAGAGADAVVKDVVHRSRVKNAEFQKESLSSRELNDISMQFFRVLAIAEMVPAATEVFVDNLPRMMNGTIEPAFELLKSSRCAALCQTAKNFEMRHGYQHRDVLKLELRGNTYIKSMMTLLAPAIAGGQSGSPLERYLYGEISENYRRVFDTTNKRRYAQYQLLCDAVSGMTENHLVKKHDEFQLLAHGST